MITDNEGKLNDEEKTFVDDPANADLFRDPLLMKSSDPERNSL